jgi:hypothetical protein
LRRFPDIRYGAAWRGSGHADRLAHPSHHLGDAPTSHVTASRRLRAEIYAASSDAETPRLRMWLEGAKAARSIGDTTSLDVGRAAFVNASGSRGMTTE